ncbi:DUF7266 family protein [Haloarcula amylovorans]|uniref:DUF7266 family protein n=1 Tax=Haloarcula amylovorans TaxID=2562280 RepID=UPI001076792C|nr:hypothetical protein [Halomicroarcula amylolytica]
MSDTRAVSTALGYTLTMAIAAILVSGLLIAGGDYVDDRREQVIRNELTVIGQQVVSDLHRTDRLVVAGRGSVTASVEQTFPERVAGSTYRLELDPGGPAVILRSTNPVIEVTVDVQTETPLAASTSDGGVVEIHYDDSSGELEVRDD